MIDIFRRAFSGADPGASIQPRFGRAGQRTAPGEAVVNRVPGDHALLAELPAQEDHLVAVVERKIDQSLINILEEASELLDLLDRLRHPGARLVEVGMQLDNFGQRMIEQIRILGRKLIDARADEIRHQLQVAHDDLEPRDEMIRFVGAEELIEPGFGQDHLASGAGINRGYLQTKGDYLVCPAPIYYGKMWIGWK